MAGGDHDTAVKLVHTGHVGHTGGGGDVQHVGVGTAGGDTSHDGVLQHIAAAAGVLTDDDAGTVVLVGATGEGRAEIPAQETAHLVGLHRGQVAVGLATETVGAEILVATTATGGSAVDHLVVVQQVVSGNAEQFADLQHLFNLGLYLIGLPLGNRLAGYRQSLCQGVLRHACGVTQVDELFTNSHSVLLYE